MFLLHILRKSLKLFQTSDPREPLVTHQPKTMDNMIIGHMIMAGHQIFSGQL